MVIKFQLKNIKTIMVIAMIVMVEIEKPKRQKMMNKYLKLGWDILEKLSDEEIGSINDLISFYEKQAKKETYDKIYQEIRDMLTGSPDEHIIVPMLAQLDFIKNSELETKEAKDDDVF